MSKNIGLSGRELEIINSTRDINIISNKELKGTFSNMNINKICSSLIKKGYFHKIKKGLYLINKEPSTLPTINDPFKIALNLYKGYLGLSSALRIHDLIEYEPFTIFLITNYKSVELNIGEYTFKIINFGDKAKYITNKKGYTVSTLEKTFFDCFLKSVYVNYSIITNALYNAKIDWDELIRIFKEFSSPSLRQRTGYILDILKSNTNYKIPEKVLSFFQKNIKNDTKLIPTLASKGKYYKKWKIIDNLGQDNILGWYNG
jgi:predicted transcriptional regulator of viral defense system